MMTMALKMSKWRKEECDCKQSDLADRYLLLLQTLPSYSFLIFLLHKTQKTEKPFYKHMV